MATHTIKSWAHFYDAIAEGRKLHDLRKMDRDYNVGDILILQRYDNINGNYTGEEQRVKITYITSNKTPCAFSSAALDRDYAILSLQLLPEVPNEPEEQIMNNDYWDKIFGPNSPNRRLARGGPIKMDISKVKW